MSNLPTGWTDYWCAGCHAKRSMSPEGRINYPPCPWCGNPDLLTTEPSAETEAKRGD